MTSDVPSASVVPTSVVPAPVVDARRVVFVCDAGGHLMEAVEIARAHFSGCDQQWYTADTPMSRSLLAGRNVTFSKRRLLPGRADLALRELLSALRVMRTMRVDTVVSPGSAYALPWMVAARIMRKQAVFIESAARMTSLSRVGSLVAKVPGVRRGTQDPFRIDGWETWPNVMSSTLADAVATPRLGDGPPRVLVTVGTFEFSFARLLDHIAEICPPEWQIVWQYGFAPPPTRGEVHESMAYERMVTEMQRADVVVGHAGVGTVLAAVAAGAQLVLAPRLGSLGEHVDDHQVELIDYVQGSPDLTAVRDVADITIDMLEAHVRRARSLA